MSSTDAEEKAGGAGAHLEREVVRRAFDRAARSCGDERIVAAEVERRMAARLEYVRLQPSQILDAGCGRAPAAALLAKRFPAARLTALDSSFLMAKAARQRGSLLARAMLALRMGEDRNVVCGDIESLPIADSSVDMVWSNLALAWASDAGRAFGEFHRVLREGGLLMFSTYGPDTLCELRSAFAAVEKQPHVHDFTDMHDLGDLLLAKGFAEPVMDMEKIVCTFADVAPMVRELRQGGQTNALLDRRRGLTGRAVWDGMRAAYARREDDRRIAATFEIVYGHAWKAGRRLRGRESPSSPTPVKWLPGRNLKR